MAGKKQRVVWIGGSVVLVLVLSIVGCFNFFLPYLEHRESLEGALAWTRMNPLPQSAANIRAWPEGGMFTREFRMTFDAPTADVNAWLAASPGSATAIVTQLGQERAYEITPGGGAQYAEVIVTDGDDGRTKVAIRAYWS